MSFKRLTVLTCLFFASFATQLQAAPYALNTIEKCKIDDAQAQCYELQTFEQADGSGAPVNIPVQYLHAREAKLAQAPVVWLNGGPGISNLEPPLPDWVFDHFDVLVIGYRGIDGTPRLDCPELKKDLKRVQKDKSIPYLSDTAFKRWRGEVSACQQNWEAQGYNTSAYSTLHVVNDIEQVRQALSLPQISLLSASYGTRIAWYYDQMHPGKLYRNLLLSGNPTGGFYFDPDTVDQQLKLLSQWCSEDLNCQEMTPDLYGSIENVLRNSPKKAWGVHIDPDHLRIVTFMLLYSRNTWPLLADAFGKAERGNNSGLAAMIKFPNPMTSNDWVWGAFFAAGSIDYDPKRDYAQELDTANTNQAVGSPLSELIFEGLSAGWKTEKLSPPALRKSNTPTLILGSEVDVATPIERIETHWLPWLTQGALVSVEGAGHAPDHIMAGGVELEAYLQSFMSGGDAESSEAFGQPIHWKPKFSLSWLAYAAWGAIGALGAALIYGLIVLI